jgi:hypothetical protein
MPAYGKTMTLNITEVEPDLETRLEYVSIWKNYDTQYYTSRT